MNKRAELEIVEEWRPVVGYEDAYEVSNLGRIRRAIGGTATHAGKVLSWSGTAGQRYTQVGLCHNGTVAHVKIHKLVAEAFCDRGDGQTEINHKDGDRKNNRADNLEWCTRQDNVKHALAHDLVIFGERSKQAKLTEKDASEIARLIAYTDTTYASIAKTYGVSESTIRTLARKQSWRRATCDVPASAMRRNRLSDADVDKIRELWESGGNTQPTIAKLFGIDRSMVSRIVNGNRHTTRMIGDKIADEQAQEATR